MKTTMFKEDGNRLIIETCAKKLLDIASSLLSHKYNKETRETSIDIDDVDELYYKCKFDAFISDEVYDLKKYIKKCTGEDFKIVYNNLYTMLQYVPESLIEFLVKCDSVRYVGALNSWTLRTCEIHNLYKMVIDAGFSDKVIINKLEEYREQLRQLDEFYRLEMPDVSHISLVPKKHQLESIEALLTHRRFMCLDDMGTGKTLTACIVAYSISLKFNRTVIIACPSSVKYSFAKQLTEIHPNASICVVEGDNIYHAHYIIINYDILSRHLDTLLSFTPIALLCDEAHKLGAVSNTGLPDSNRAMSALRLANTVQYCYPITGTPIKDKVKQLYNLLVMVDSEDSLNFVKFGMLYCDGKQGRGGWNFNGSSNTEILHAKLQKVSIRHKKEDIGLPPVVRTFMPVKVDLTEYNKALEDFMQNYDLGMAQNLVRIGAMKKFLAYAKWEETYKSALDILENKDSVVIFTDYLYVVDKLKSKFKDRCMTITGEDTSISKNNKEKMFQNGEVPVAIVCIGAGGEGLNLHHSDTAIYNDMPWSPTKQSDSRVNRLGQKADTSFLVYTKAEGALMDEKMIELLDMKTGAIDAVVDNKENTFNADIMRIMYETLGRQGINSIYAETTQQMYKEEIEQEKEKLKDSIVMYRYAFNQDKSHIESFFIDNEDKKTGECLYMYFNENTVNYYCGIYKLNKREEIHWYSIPYDQCKNKFSALNIELQAMFNKFELCARYLQESNITSYIQVVNEFSVNTEYVACTAI